MTLTTSIAATTKNLTLQVRINNVLLVPSSPTSATGIPGVSAVRIQNRIGQAPVCSIETNRTPTWINRGMSVTIDVGYDGFTRRRFTGTVQDRSKGIGKGTINCVGASSPLYTTSIIPDQDFSGSTTNAALLTLLAYVGIVNKSVTTTRSDVTEFTLGSVVPATLQNMGAIQMVNYIMELQGCKLFETGAGVTVINVIDQIPAPTPLKTYTTNNNATARILTSDLREDATFVRTRVKVTGATPTGGTTLTSTAQVGGVSPLVKPPLPSGSYIDAGIFNSLADVQSKLDLMALFYLTQWHRVPKYLDVDIPGDPELECGATIGLVIPEQDISGNFFIDGWEDTITIPSSENDTSGGYRTTLSGLRGGDDLGGTLTLAPIASFTMAVEEEVFGTGTAVWAVVTLTDTSYDPDGSIASRVWTSNKTTTPTMASSVAAQRTVRIDTSTLDGSGTDWTITETVTDNSGATAAYTQIVPYTTSTLVTIPAMGLAYNSGFGFSPDGGQHWNDVTGATCVSVGLRPSDGVNFGHALAGFSNGVIKRTTDGGLSSATVYTLSSGAAINFVVYDWRNTVVAWALSNDMQLLISLDAGATWTIYDALRTVLSLAGAIAGRRCVGLPAGGGVYVFGGDGAGTPLIAFDATVGSHVWNKVTLTGDIATDFPADATCKIVDYTAPGTGKEVMILSFASGGGGSIQPIYQTATAASTSRAFTRATGLTAGLKNGVYVVSDSALAGQFYAAFGDRDVWTSSDGIAWVQTANVMPAGVTPNDAIYAAGLLTGLPDFQGLFLVAAENAGTTLGLYKSADGLQTVSPLRPAGGSWPTWPASGKGKMVSIGAPGSTAPAGNGRVMATTQTGSPHQETQLVSSNVWAALKAMTGLTNDSNPRPFCLTRTNWFVCDSSSAGNQPAYTKDGGTTWAALSANLIDVTWFARGAAGRIWCCVEFSSSVSKYYYSDDAGDNWTLAKTTSGNNKRCTAIACHPTNPNIVAVFGNATNPGNVGFCDVSTDNGANWASNLGGPREGQGGSPQIYGFQILQNGRFVISGALAGGAPIPWSIQTSDDQGVTWTSRYSEAGNAIRYYSLGAYGSKVVVWRESGASPGVGEPLVSTDSATTFTLTVPSQTLQGFTGTTTDGASAMAFDGPNDALYLALSSNGSFPVLKFTPVSAAGVFSNLKFNIPSTTFGVGNLSVVPA